MLTPAAFAARMAPLGPWGTSLAVAVSGGADSLCLAWLARHWGPTALIVDHGLRAASAREATLAAQRLAGFGVPSRILPVAGLAPGPGLAARAREARYAALARACAALGLTDLLLGHHAGDQAETVLMRREAASGAAGLAGMAALAERPSLRLVRPLLGIEPARLRATLRAAGIGWVEDPSNADPSARRTVLRARLARGAPGQRTGLRAAAREAAACRAGADGRIAATLAARASLFPEGYALLTPGPIAPECLASLLRMLGRAPHAPHSRAVARLAASPTPATLGGVRLMPAGALGPGLLLVREPACLGPPVPARDGALWDGRFVLSLAAAPPAGMLVAALGEAASRLRHLSPLPYAVLRSLPALWRGGEVALVPHLAYARPSAAAFTGWTNLRPKLTLCPPCPAAGAAWVGDAQAVPTHHVGCEGLAGAAMFPGKSGQAGLFG